MHCMLVGNYGVGNVGDEALKDFFLERFPEVEWTVLSAHPAGTEVARFPGGIRSFFSFRWTKTLQTLRSCDAMVFGGGSLFTDVESVYACFLWFVHAMIARWYNKPIILAFQGVGPFDTWIGEWFARTVFRRASFISVRDDASLLRISRWGLNTKTILSFDPIYEVLFEQNRDSTKKILTIIPRKNSDKNFLKNVKETVGQEWDEIHIISMEPDTEEKVCHEIQSEIGQKSEIIFIRTINELKEVISRSAFVLSQRYHGALAALALNVPFQAVPQSEGDKLDALRGAISMRGEFLARVQAGEKALREALQTL